MQWGIYTNRPFRTQRFVEYGCIEPEPDRWPRIEPLRVNVQKKALGVPQGATYLDMDARRTPQAQI